MSAVLLCDTCGAGDEVVYPCALNNGADHCVNCLWDCPKCSVDIILERYKGEGRPVWRGSERGQG